MLGTSVCVCVFVCVLSLCCLCVRERERHRERKRERERDRAVTRYVVAAHAQTLGPPAVHRTSSGEAMAASNMVQYWYIAECPWKDECSKASWQKTRSCHSYESPEVCRQLLLKHLQSSGNHWWTSEEDLHRAVADTPVLTDTCKKRFYPSQYQGEEGGGASAAKRVKVSPSTAGGSFSATADALAVLSAVPGGASSSGSDEVTVPRGMLLRIMGIVETANAAAQHAQQIADAARAAFAEQQAKLQECAQELRELVAPSLVRF